MATVKSSEEITEIDQDGKQISKSIKQTINWGSEPAYIKMYIQDILYMSDIPQKHDRVLMALLKRMSYAHSETGMEIVVNSSLKKRIAKELGLKNEGSISNAITNLVKGNVLIRTDIGIYQFNPWLFGKGDWQDIIKLRMQVDYSEIKGRTFKTVCEYKDSQNTKETTKQAKARTKKEREIDELEEDRDTDQIEFDEDGVYYEYDDEQPFSNCPEETEVA